MSDSMNKATDSKYVHVDINEVPASPPVSDLPNLAFTKAAFAFRDNLTKSHSRPAPKPLQPKTAEYAPVQEPTSPASDSKTSTREKRILWLRMTHHTLTSLLSIAIAGLQLAAYVVWSRTKNIPGAWPETPNLFPTLMLMAVAIGALVIDIAVIITHILPGNAARRAEKLADFVMYIINGIKYTAYAVAATACRSVFETHTLNDLWAWTCSAEADAQSSVNGGGSSCTAQTAAWALAITQIILEGANVIINLYAKRVASKAAQAEEAGTESASPLMKRDERMSAMADNSQDMLGELTPNMKSG